MKITLNSLAKTYGENHQAINAVKNVSLHIPSNTVYGIIGKSGAGKSTLVRLISLLETPDTGSVYYGDERVDNLPKNVLIQRRRKIGMIFQSFNLFSSRNAADNIAYPLEIAGIPKAKIKKRVEELLNLVDLAGRGNAPISTLSGGQKQRVAIARSLANHPDILFCDEATSALDPQTTRAILQLLRDIQKKMQLTIVMITHQMEVVRDACDYVAVLDEGRVAEEAQVEQLFAHPKSHITKDFLANLSTTQTPFVENSDFLQVEENLSKNFVRWSGEGGKYVLRFVGAATGEPVLSRLSRRFNVEFNIRAGGIQHLPENNIGTLITDMSGESAELQKALAWLEDQGVIVETEEEK